MQINKVSKTDVFSIEGFLHCLNCQIVYVWLKFTVISLQSFGLFQQKPPTVQTSAINLQVKFDSYVQDSSEIQKSSSQGSVSWVVSFYIHVYVKWTLDASGMHLIFIFSTAKLQGSVNIIFISRSIKHDIDWKTIHNMTWPK